MYRSAEITQFDMAVLDRAPSRKPGMKVLPPTQTQKDRAALLSFMKTAYALEYVMHIHSLALMHAEA